MFKFSSKPVALTLRDGVLMGVLTVLVLLLIAVAWYSATGNLEYIITEEYWYAVGRSFAGAVVLALAYEYTGLNAKLSAETMRYATGSTLQKYVSRNAALVAETLAGSETPYGDILRACVRLPRAMKLIIRGATDEEIIARYGVNASDLALVRMIPATSLPAVPRLCELFGKNPDLIKYISMHGFDAVRTRKNMYGELTLDVDTLARASGIKIV